MTHSTSAPGSTSPGMAAVVESDSSPGRLGTWSHRLLRSTTALHVAVLALLAYVPTLTAAPGRMPTDTKLFLYLDPGRLTRDSLFSWDSRQFAGWVPHQTVSYLWPSGPWYSVFNSLGFPDWVAHRLWIGTLMFVAGLGVRWLAKLLGIQPSGALVAALFYQLSPYILPYLSRTSTMLLPWAGLGWLIGLTIRAATRTKWRDVGVFGLVMATVAATNATAILMIAPAPVLWLLHAAWERSITWRRAAVVAVKLGGISLVMSAWWISMLAVQGAYGADVLGYSETLEAVSLTSSSTEVVRGLGYWLFYVRDPVGFTTSAAFEYMASGRAIAVTLLILGLGLVGLVATRWTSRRFAVLLVFVGVVLAVGVHPIDDPSPLMSGLADNSRSSLALAMRSSTRAIPLSSLGLALGLGALATAVARTRSRTRFRLRRFVPVVLAILAIVNLPVLLNGGMVDPILTRDENPPDSWEQATDALDALPDGFRVLQLPGIEFGAFRWGYTVDPPLPGMTNRPLVTRDLLPLGSSGAMDLLYAFDDRFQDGTAEISAVAAVARLLGADTVWLPNDVAFDRFRTPRPEATSAMFDDPSAQAGIGQSAEFGAPEPNVPTISMIDEESVGNAAVGQPLPAVELVPILDPVPVVRVKTEEVIVAGSGDGLVDAAAAGILSGNELLRYAVDVVANGDSIDAAERVVITDSNRDRAHHWHGSQDVWGFTEDGSTGQGVLTFDTSDQRIPVFTDQDSSDQTIAEQRGGTTATASSYGEPFAYRPESRAAMAVDGDITTAWVVADRFDARGEFLRLIADTPFTTVQLTQPQGDRNRWITRVDITDSSGTYSVDLTDESRSAVGQQVTLRSPSVEVTLAIAETAVAPGTAPNAVDAVGFAEAMTEAGPTDEVVRVPSNVLTDVTSTQDLDIVLTRLRTRPTNRWRSDPEPSVTRSFTLADQRQFTTSVTTRLHRRAPDSVIAQLLGWTGTTADKRLTGVPTMGGWAATDGDASTSWVTPFGDAVGSTVTIPLAVDLSPAGARFNVQQPLDGTFNTITSVVVRGAGDGASGEQTVSIAAPDAAGSSIVDVVGLSGSALNITIAATTATTTTDRRYAEQVLLPAAISEVTGEGIVAMDLPMTFDSGCRTDLVTIDETPIGVSLVGNVASLFAGDPATTTICSSQPITLEPGEHLVRSAAGSTTGLDVDRIVLRSDVGTSADDPLETAVVQPTVVDNGRIDRTVVVEPCPDGCWFVFGEGYNTGWSATLDGRSMGTQDQVDGGFNGWYLPPSTESRTIRLTWDGQSRLTIGIALSALGVLLCIGLIAFDRKRSDSPLLSRPMLADEWPGQPVERPLDVRGPAVATTVAALVLGGLVISPLFGLLCAAIAAVFGIGLRRPHLIGAVAVVMMAAIGTIMLRRFLIVKPFANAGWPGYFEDLHRPAMAAIVLLAVSVLARPSTTDHARSARES